jgi:hypothetical protein
LTTNLATEILSAFLSPPFSISLVVLPWWFTALKLQEVKEILQGGENPALATVGAFKRCPADPLATVRGPPQTQ